jgi:hypothetical protein
MRNEKKMEANIPCSANILLIPLQSKYFEAKSSVYFQDEPIIN